MPDIKGIWNEWGKSIFHCPYCHGYEFKNKSIGFIGNGNFAEHIVPMLWRLSSDITIFTQQKADFSQEFSERIKDRRIGVYESSITSFVRNDNVLNAVVLNNGDHVHIDALFAGPILLLELSSNIAEVLGCETDEIGFIKVNQMGKTSVDGVFASGDIITMKHSVVGALASGQIAGSAIVSELVHEDV